MIEGTVGWLRQKLEGLSDDMPVLYQRIEDVYFEKHSWKTISVKWEYDNTEGIEIFSAYVTTDATGKKYLLIHAHY